MTRVARAAAPRGISEFGLTNTCCTSTRQAAQICQKRLIPCTGGAERPTSAMPTCPTLTRTSVLSSSCPRQFLGRTQRTIEFKLDHMDDYQRGQHEHTRRFPPKQARNEMAAELMDVEKSWKSCYEATETLPGAFKQSKWFTRGLDITRIARAQVLF